MVAISSNLFLVSTLERPMDLREASFKEEPEGFFPVRFLRDSRIWGFGLQMTHMAETRRSAWRAAFASTLRSSAWPSSLEPLGESRELVFSSVKNWRGQMMMMVMRLKMKRLTCW